MKVPLWRGIVATFWERVATQYAPRAKQYSDNHPVIVDTLQSVLRTGGAIQTSVFRKIFLIKENQPHTKYFQIRLEHRLSQIFRIGSKKGGKSPSQSFSFPIIHCNCRLNVAYSYFSDTLGMSTIAYVPFISSCVARNASRSSRLMRLRWTLLPCFLPTEIPIVILADGRYNIVKEGENTRFPFWNSRWKSACFFNLRYFIYSGFPSRLKRRKVFYLKELF